MAALKGRCGFTEAEGKGLPGVSGINAAAQPRPEARAEGQLCFVRVGPRPCVQTHCSLSSRRTLDLH